MRRGMAALSLALFSALAMSQPEHPGTPWPQQNSGVDVQLRGISAVSQDIAWASGAKGTVLRTVDGGMHWEKVNVPNAEALDFRDVQAFDWNNAFVLSIGPGEQSRIYKTSDGGKTWQLQFTNKDPKAFYDCFAFWDSKHGIALSDSVDGKFPLLATADGVNWNPVVVKKMPAALPNEGAFAASGTCIATFGKKDVWFGTGGPTARVFHSSDRGSTWSVAETPILHGEASQGIFSVLFWSEKNGVVVGGDYKDPAKSDKTAAVTNDGGRTWSLALKFPQGYRSSVAVVNSSPIALMSVGTSGADLSQDGGNNWTSLFNSATAANPNSSPTEFNAIGFSQSGGIAVGAGGKIIQIRLNYHP